MERRHTTGCGGLVQAGLYETVAMLMAQHMAQAAITGEAPPPMSVRRPAWPIYDIFDTSDGGQVFVGVVTDTQWRVFCKRFGFDDWLADDSLSTQSARLAQRARTLPAVASAFATLTRTELMDTCEALGLPFAPIGRPAELFDDPHLNGSDGLIALELPDGRATKLPALPLALDGQRFGRRRGLPRVGEHNDEITAELSKELASGCNRK